MLFLFSLILFITSQLVTGDYSLALLPKELFAIIGQCDEEILLPLSLVSKDIRSVLNQYADYLGHDTVERRGIIKALKELNREESILYSFKDNIRRAAERKFIDDFLLSKACFVLRKFDHPKQGKRPDDPIRPSKVSKFLTLCNSEYLDKFFHDLRAILYNQNTQSNQALYKDTVKILSSSHEYSRSLSLENSPVSIILYDYGLKDLSFDISTTGLQKKKITYIFSPHYYTRDCDSSDNELPQNTANMLDCWFLRHLDLFHRLVLNGEKQYIGKTLNFPLTENLKEVILCGMQTIKKINLSMLVNLEYLKIDSAYQLEDIFFPPRIKKISISQCHSLEPLNLSESPQLQELILRNNNILEFENIIWSKKQHKKLEKLTLGALGALEILSYEDYFMPNLKELIINDSILDIGHNFKNFHYPEKISIRNFKKLEYIDVRKTQRTLEIKYCPALTRVILNIHSHNIESCSIERSGAKKLRIEKNKETALYIKSCNNVKKLLFFTSNYRSHKNKLNLIENVFTPITIENCAQLRSVKCCVNKKHAMRNEHNFIKEDMKNSLYEIGEYLNFQSDMLVQKDIGKYEVFTLKNDGDEPITMSKNKVPHSFFPLLRLLWIQGMMFGYFYATDILNEENSLPYWCWMFFYGLVTSWLLEPFKEEPKLQLH